MLEHLLLQLPSCALLLKSLISYLYRNTGYNMRSYSESMSIGSRPQNIIFIYHFLSRLCRYLPYSLNGFFVIFIVLQLANY